MTGVEVTVAGRIFAFSTPGGAHDYVGHLVEEYRRAGSVFVATGHDGTVAVGSSAEATARALRVAMGDAEILPSGG